jgi:uncharacterized protein YbcI
VKKNKITVALDVKALNTNYKVEKELKEELRKILGAELTESDGDKVSVLFESAVNAKLNKLLPAVAKQFNTQVAARVVEIKEELTDNISDYLSYVVEQWFDENKQAITTGLKAARDNTLIEELQKVFATHLVSVPNKGENLVESLEKKLKKAERQLSESQDNNIALKNRVAGLKCERVFEDLSEGLAATEAEKFMTLVEDLEVNDPKDFETKAKIIRDAHFPKAKTLAESKVDAKAAAGKVLTESKQVGSKAASTAKTNDGNGNVIDMSRALKKSRFAS